MVVAIDKANAVNGVASAAELSGIVRELKHEYKVLGLQGSIVGAALMGLSGECTSKKFEMDTLIEGE